MDMISSSEQRHIVKSNDQINLILLLNGNINLASDISSLITGMDFKFKELSNQYNYTEALKYHDTKVLLQNAILWNVNNMNNIKTKEFTKYINDIVIQYDPLCDDDIITLLNEVVLWNNEYCNDFNIDINKEPITNIFNSVTRDTEISIYEILRLTNFTNYNDRRSNMIIKSLIKYAREILKDTDIFINIDNTIESNIETLSTFIKNREEVYMINAIQWSIKLLTLAKLHYVNNVNVNDPNVLSLIKLRNIINDNINDGIDRDRSTIIAMETLSDHLLRTMLLISDKTRI